MIKDELEQVSVKLEVLVASMKNQAQEPRPLIHPSMARRYREQIENLRKLLEGERSGEAREHVRETIEKIVLTQRGWIRDGHRSLWITGRYLENSD